MKFVSLWIVLFSAIGFQEPDKSESLTKWEPEIRALEKLQASEKTEHAIVFYGSSSIRRWDSLSDDMAPWASIRRGYGGAKSKDIVHFGPRILGPHIGIDNPYRCRAIVLFVANDITGDPASDLSPADVAMQFEQLHRWIRSKDATLPIFWIEVTPTASRWGVWDQITAATQKIRAVLDRDPAAYLIPTAGAFLGVDGRPAKQFFVKDNLHLNEDGYKLWSALIKAQLHLRLGEAVAAE